MNGKLFLCLSLWGHSFWVLAPNASWIVILFALYCNYNYFLSSTCLGISGLWKPFSFLHALCTKCVISIAGNDDEWQKMPAGSSRKGRKTEQGAIVFCLPTILKSNLSPCHKSQRKQFSAAVEQRDFQLFPMSCWCHRHSWDMPGNGLACKKNPLVLVPKADFGWPCPNGREKHSTIIPNSIWFCALGRYSLLFVTQSYYSSGHFCPLAVC